MAAIFAHSSSGPVPLRTLTLGVLIVSGGTLAALPFRRYHAIPDSSTTPVHATGPTSSALQMGTTSPVSDAIFTPPQMAEAIIPGSILATHSEINGAGDPQDQHLNSLDRITNLSKTERSPETPLTYEDLVLPIEMPDILQQRFNATAAVKSIQMEKERLADNAGPRMEPMTATSSGSAGPSLLASQPRNDATGRSIMQPSTLPQNRIQATASKQSDAVNNANSFATIADPAVAGQETAAGSLASTGSDRGTSAKPPAFDTPALLPAPEEKDLLPRTDPSSRPRHWIRQPN